MARLFDDASSDKLTSSTTPITAVGFTVVGRFRADALPQAPGVLFSISDSTTPGTTGQWAISINAATSIASGSRITCWSRKGSGDSAINAYVASATIDCTQDQWHSFVAVFAADNDRRMFLDGGSKGTNTAAANAQSGINVVDFGRAGDLTPSSPYSGDMAEVAIYDYVFSDADAAVFANRINPLLHRPGNIVAYWPLYGHGSTESDIVGNHNAAVAGATKSNNPPVIYPSAQILQFPPVAAAPTTSFVVADQAQVAARPLILTYPDSIADDDLFIIVTWANGSTEHFDTVPTGFTEMVGPSGVIPCHAIYYRHASASDTGDISITLSHATREMAGVLLHVTGNYPLQDPEISSASSATSTAPDSNSLTLSGWGSGEDTLWLSTVIADYDSGSDDITVFPSGYAEDVEYVYSSKGVIGIGSKTLDAASENPGAFTLAVSQQWYAYTLGIRPAATAVYPYQIHKHKRGGMNVLLTR